MSGWKIVHCTIEGCSGELALSVHLEERDGAPLLGRFLAAAGWLVTEDHSICSACAQITLKVIDRLRIEQAVIIDAAYRRALQLRRIQVVP